MRVEIEYKGYNQRRYSRPWGSLATFDGAKMRYDFNNGNYLGDDTGGTVYIECEPGDVVASGQKDFSGSITVRKLYIVQDDGALIETDQNEALKHFESRKEQPSPLEKFTDDELIEELKRRGYSVDK